VTSRPETHKVCPFNGKVRFATPAEARAASGRPRRGSKRGPQRTYHCTTCGGWHLTSQTKGEVRRYKCSPATSRPESV
jgi:hypothetical protein